MGGKIEVLSWSTAGGWTARWAAGAVLGQIVFGPTTMLFIALITGVTLGAGAMYLAGRRTRERAMRMSRTAASGHRRPFVPPARPAASRATPAAETGPSPAAPAEPPAAPVTGVPEAAEPLLRARSLTALVPVRLAALASRSWRVLRRPRDNRPPRLPRFSPRSGRRVYSPLAPR